MHSNELTDFVQMAQATHSYTDKVVAAYFEKIAQNSSGEQFSQMMGVLKAYRPRIYAAVMRHLSDDGSG